MKVLSILLLAALAIVSWYPMGSADRLHHWIDSNGVTHLSKEPPPQDGKLIEIMEYSVRVDKPAKTEQVKPIRKPEIQNRHGNVKTVPETKTQMKPTGDLATACYLYADPEEVYVYVTEYTDPDRVLETVLYRGTIPKGQKQLIETLTGKIIYSYQRSSDDRAYGDNHADCVKGNVMSIP